MHRLATILLAILAVIVLAGAVYVISDNGSAPPAAAPKSTLAPSPTAAVSGPTSSPSKTPPTQGGTTVTVAPQAQPVVAFFGDDWTSGAGASSKKKRFSSIVSNKLGLLERNFGQTGTGYSSYGDRVTDVAAVKPDVVVVAGGRNDIVDGKAGAAVSGAKKLFTALHAKLPDAVLIAVAPMWGDSDPLPALKDLAAAVKKAVTAAGGKYLDIADPVNGHPEYMADAADPADNGYAAIADAIEPALSPLLPK